MKKSSNTSRNTKNLQQQLFRALIIQTFIPLIPMYIPISILFTFPMIGYDIGQIGLIVPFTIALYPAIDPLPNMLIIKNYRTAVIQIFRKCFLWASSCKVDVTLNTIT
ncbi:unnamed protein product [Caenorhabditis angaria]|uniref:Uncharacterized protein n=1 Tax=Caenorhabditis angaria TaxID=860376 RepID=A0A9P1IZ80_9PELO|nr:unnamed protein product [Caenorhabditis angaria]